jgi:hypothetical protein
MSTLSLRLPPALSSRLDEEVARRGTTRSRFVQEVLQRALAPKDPVQLLEEVRAAYRLPAPAARPAEQRTEASLRVKEGVRTAAAAKRGGQRKVGSGPA